MKTEDGRPLLGGVTGVFSSMFGAERSVRGVRYRVEIIKAFKDALRHGRQAYRGLVDTGNKRASTRIGNRSRSVNLLLIWKGIWGGLKSIFGGPSEAELAAREMFSGFHKLVRLRHWAGRSDTPTKSSVAINDGWDRTLAETRAGFILMGTDMGKTYDEAFSDYERYQNAVGAGNTELMAQIEAEYAEWRAASEETTEAVVHDAAEIGRQFKGLSAEEAAELGDALIGLGSKANKSFTDIHDGAIAAGNALANEFLPHIKTV